MTKMRRKKNTHIDSQNTLRELWAGMLLAPESVVRRSQFEWLHNNTQEKNNNNNKIKEEEKNLEWCSGCGIDKKRKKNKRFSFLLGPVCELQIQLLMMTLLRLLVVGSFARCMHHDEAFSSHPRSPPSASHFFIWIIWYLSDGSGIRIHVYVCIGGVFLFYSAHPQSYSNASLPRRTLFLHSRRYACTWFVSRQRLLRVPDNRGARTAWNTTKIPPKLPNKKRGEKREIKRTNGNNRK